MIDFKLKGGAIQLTLAIVVIIALLLMTFVLFVHSHNLFNTKSDFITQTIKNSNKAIDYVLLNDIKLNDSIIIKLDDNHDKTLKVHREFWGVFERVTSVSSITNNVMKKAALVGGVQSEKNRTALYLQDNNQPLVVVGNTMIKGLAYLPKKGVKSGNISGQSYYGSQLIYGNSKTSSYLPKLNSEIVLQIDKLNHKYLKAKSEEFLNIKSNNTYSNSFFKPTEFVFSNNEISLGRIQLIGNIIIQSKTKIIVNSSSILKDVILIAPEIEVKDNVKGSFQAFAKNNIIVGSNVTLDYPTVLYLSEDKTSLLRANDKKTSRILLKSNSNIKGSVIFISYSKSNNYESQIELQDDSTVVGELYCNKNINLKGMVFGSVYTDSFITKQSGSIYQNHIYNGTINIDKLQEQYAGVRLSNSKKRVVKWLY